MTETLTQEQRWALADAFMSAGIRSSDQRAVFIGLVIPDWIHGGDLGWLSPGAADLVLAALANRNKGATNE